MKIIFATNNHNKLQEIREILGPAFEIVSLADIGCHDDIPETGETLEENALQKVNYIFERYHIACFADDTGLEVEALNGEPGVHSARYAEGTDHDSEANMRKLLLRLQDSDNRHARFRTVIALREHDGKTTLFEGEVAGRIAREKTGTAGFGYDPIFIPEDYSQSFAEMGETEKNKISHRARAVRRAADDLSRPKT